MIPRYPFHDLQGAKSRPAYRCTMSAALGDWSDRALFQKDLHRVLKTTHRSFFDVTG
jgi:hypothetical protein